MVNCIVYLYFIQVVVHLFVITAKVCFSLTSMIRGRVHRFFLLPAFRNCSSIILNSLPGSSGNCICGVPGGQVVDSSGSKYDYHLEYIWNHHLRDFFIFHSALKLNVSYDLRV